MEREELITTLAKLNKAEVHALWTEVAARREKLARDAYAAAQAGDMDAVMLAVEAGAEMGGVYGTSNIIQAVEVAVTRNDPSMLTVLLDVARNRFPSLYPDALVVGVYNAVKEGKLGAYDSIRFHISAWNAWDAWETGTGPFRSTPYSYHVSINGRLEMAAEHGHEDMVARIISEWPDVAEFDYPYRLLSAAVKSGKPAILKQLLDAGLQDKGEAYAAAAMEGLKVGDLRFLALLRAAGLDLDAPCRMSRDIRGMWADDKPLLSVRWVLQNAAMQANHWTGEIASTLRGPEQA
jgi:hypothetical protein